MTMFKRFIRYYAKFKNRRLEKKWRSSIKADNFSIICSTCIGGVIYNRLGREFLSPTVNMFILQKDFIKFVSNLPHYIAMDLQFIETDKPYPVAMLDDIVLYFNHSNTPEDAANDWNRRKERINYKNLYIILYNRDGCTLDDLRKMENVECKRFIVLTSTPIDLPYAYWIKENKGKVDSGVFLDKDMLGIRTFEKQWDFVSWLNGDH